MEAVISIEVNGEWHRLMATDCRGLFHVEIASAELRALPPFRHWNARSEGQKRRRKKEREPTD